jgi:hypothetical protein
MLGVARMDLPNTSGNVHMLMGKTLRERFYSPEYETRKKDILNQRYFGDSGAQVDQEQRYYEDYRKAANLYGQWGGVVDTDKLYFASYSNPNAQAEDYRTISSDVFDPLFTGNMGGGSNVHYCLQNEVRMLRKSPVRPPAAITGVS